MNVLVPSTLADSYKSLGIFNNIPVVDKIVYGIPIHTFTKIITILVIATAPAEPSVPNPNLWPNV